VMAMDLAGVAVSAGAACTSGKVKSSHVLRAMGYGEDVAGSGLRISLGWNTGSDDLDHAVEAWRALYSRTRNNRQSQAA
jgi:cysteine desulfurase